MCIERPKDQVSNMYKHDKQRTQSSNGTSVEQLSDSSHDSNKPSRNMVSEKNMWKQIIGDRDWFQKWKILLDQSKNRQIQSELQLTCSYIWKITALAESKTQMESSSSKQSQNQQIKLIDILELRRQQQKSSKDKENNNFSNKKST